MKKNQVSSAPDELRFAVLATDTVLFTIRDESLYVRIIEVNRPPYYEHAWAFPGGLLLPTETAEQAATRLLHDKAGIDPVKVYAEQLYTFSDINRDPRNRVVAVGYVALVAWEKLSEEERFDTPHAKWIPVKNIGKLAYDHDEVLKMALARLRSRVTYTTLLSKLLPSEFTLTELEKAYACVLKTNLDKRNFRKKILKLKILKALNKKRAAGRSRPAELYRFISSKVIEIEVL
jgi:8-oxo-dGTP diphosphatase